MKTADIIGDLEDNLEILLSMGATQLDQRLICQTLESGSNGCFERLKRMVHNGGDDNQKMILLESLVSMGDNYAREGLSYAQELAGQISDDVLLNVARNVFSYSFNNDDFQLMKLAVSITEKIEGRDARSLKKTDHHNLGKAYYTFALDEDKVEEFDAAITNFEKGKKQGEEYANSLLVRGLLKDDGLFERGVEAYDFRSFDVKRTINLIERFNGEQDDYTRLVRMAGFMAGSCNAEIFNQGIDKLNRAYELSDIGQREGIFELALDLYKKNRDLKIAGLVEKTAKDLFEDKDEEEKMELVERLFSIKEDGLSELAAGFIEETAYEKNTFDEIFAYGKLLSGKRLYPQAEALFDHALAVDADYKHLVQVGEEVLKRNKQDAGDYFKQALQKRARLSDYEDTGDFLLDKGLKNLAGEFYEKCLGKRRSPDKCLAIAEYCLEQGHEDLYMRFADHAAEKAKNLEEHLEIYDYYLEKPSPKRLKEVLVKGFERFDDVEDYGFALRYFEESHGLAAAGRFASQLSCVSDEVEELCQSYISKAEKERKKSEKKAEQKKKEEEAERQKKLGAEAQRIKEAGSFKIDRVILDSGKLKSEGWRSLNGLDDETIGDLYSYHSAKKIECEYIPKYKKIY